MDESIEEIDLDFQEDEEKPNETKKNSNKKKKRRHDKKEQTEDDDMNMQTPPVARYPTSPVTNTMTTPTPEVKVLKLPSRAVRKKFRKRGERIISSSKPLSDKTFQDETCFDSSVLAIQHMNFDDSLTKAMQDRKQLRALQLLKICNKKKFAGKICGKTEKSWINGFLSSNFSKHVVKIRTLIGELSGTMSIENICKLSQLLDKHGQNLASKECLEICLDIMKNNVLENIFRMIKKDLVDNDLFASLQVTDDETSRRCKMIEGCLKVVHFSLHSIACRTFILRTELIKDFIDSFQ